MTETLKTKIETAKKLAQEIDAKNQMLGDLIKDICEAELKMPKDKPFKLIDVIEAAAQ